MISVYFSEIFTKFLILDSFDILDSSTHTHFSREKIEAVPGFAEELWRLEPSAPLALLTAARVAGRVSWDWLQDCANPSPLQPLPPLKNLTAA